MYKNITLTIKRLFISVLIFAMCTATVTSFAAVSVKTEDAEFELDEVPLGTSVTYDVETKEVYYGMGQDSETILSGEPTYVPEDCDISPFVNLPTPVTPPIVGIVGETDTR